MEHEGVLFGHWGKAPRQRNGNGGKGLGKVKCRDGSEVAKQRLGSVSGVRIGE